MECANQLFSTCKGRDEGEISAMDSSALFLISFPIKE
jgi:hypothetical protein